MSSTGFMLLAALVAAHCADSDPLDATEPQRFPDRSTTPRLSSASISVLAALDHIPGNIAVAPGGDVFFTYHPVGYEDVTKCKASGACSPGKVMRLRDGKATPFPSADFEYQTVLGLRVDSNDHLWVLDHGFHGQQAPALICFDSVTHEQLFHHKFKKSVAGPGSMLNDLAVSPDSRFVYIADCSIGAGTPAIIVFDSETQKSWRVLEGHPSVQAAQGIAAYVNGESLDFPWAVGVDSIALSEDGNWLYYAAIYDQSLHRVATHSVNGLYNTTLEVEVFAEKTASDGIVVHKGQIYLTDYENSAITVIDESTRELSTLVQDRELLRWPDGVAAAGNELYVSASAIHELVRGKAAPPYHLVKIDLNSGASTQDDSAHEQEL